MGARANAVSPRRPRQARRHTIGRATSANWRIACCARRCWRPARRFSPRISCSDRAQSRSARVARFQRQLRRYRRATGLVELAASGGGKEVRGLYQSMVAELERPLIDHRARTRGRQPGKGGSDARSQSQHAAQENHRASNRPAQRARPIETPLPFLRDRRSLRRTRSGRSGAHDDRGGRANSPVAPQGYAGARLRRIGARDRAAVPQGRRDLYRERPGRYRDPGRRRRRSSRTGGSAARRRRGA